MAIICITCFPKRSINLILPRLLKQMYCEQKLVQTSAKSLVDKRDAPIKFSTNKASTITITETTGLLNEDNDKKRYTVHIMFASMAVFLLYFCVLREENDVDEILKGNLTSEDDKVKLLNLQIQLKYCESNKLPTEKLKAKISELEEKMRKTSVFVK